MQRKAALVNEKQPGGESRMFPNHLTPSIVDYCATGSRVIVSPPVMDTDEDYVVLVQSIPTFAKRLNGDGWKLDGKDYGTGAGINNFKSFRKAQVNLIVTDNKLFFARYKFATRIGQALNLAHKEDRVALFEMIRDLPEEVYA
jgi:hypothetical protein